METAWDIKPPSMKEFKNSISFTTSFTKCFIGFTCIDEGADKSKRSRRRRHTVMHPFGVEAHNLPKNKRKDKGEEKVQVEEKEEGLVPDEGMAPEEGSTYDEEWDDEDMPALVIDEETDELGVEVKVEVSSDSDDEEWENTRQGLPSPIFPTKAMVEAHMISHIPYANWCTYCVRGRGAQHAHRTVKERDDNLPVLSVDYCIDPEGMPIAHIRHH